MAEDFIRDIEHRFDVGGTVYVAQVCSPKPHSAAPMSASAFDVQIVTFAGNDFSDFENNSPEIGACTHRSA